ncbi:hypothetical protein THAOC_18070, partial [Thalassiosira oceanica]
DQSHRAGRIRLRLPGQERARRQGVRREEDTDLVPPRIDAVGRGGRGHDRQAKTGPGAPRGQDPGPARSSQHSQVLHGVARGRQRMRGGRVRGERERVQPVGRGGVLLELDLRRLLGVDQGDDAAAPAAVRSRSSGGPAAALLPRRRDTRRAGGVAPAGDF